MMAFEQRVCGNAEKAAQFYADCRETFATEAGQRLIIALCEAAHPLDHSPVPGEVAVADRGRKEVVALLWRYGWASQNTYPPLPSPALIVAPVAALAAVKSAVAG